MRVESISKTITVADGGTEEVFSDMTNSSRTVWEGAFFSDQDVTLRLSRGEQGGVWLSEEDEAYSAGVGEPFSAEILARQAKFEIINSSGAVANCRIELNVRRYDR